MTEKGTNYWPKKHNILGVNISETNYNEILEVLIKTAKEGRSACVVHLPVHGLVEGLKNTRFKTMLNEFDIVAPDGQPIRIALNLLHKTKILERCYGPEMMLRLCNRFAQEDFGVYLYGSHPHVLEKLRMKLMVNFPSLKIVGYESPPFRPLNIEEDEAVVSRINKSGAVIVFLGLGCPKQEIFAYEHRQNIKSIQICVGAAFDFISGNKKMAPAWMQQYSLEWFFRLLQEPQRLWKRYLFTNTIFLSKLLLHVIRPKKK